MTLELAHRYLKAFIGELPLDDMRLVLSKDLVFEGPFISCSNASDYIDSLKKNPLENASFRILDEFENENSACILYELVKPEVILPIAQWFKSENGKIVEIRVIFDSGRLT